MFNRYVIFLTIVCAAIWGFHRELVNGDVLQYIDAHPHPIYTPPVLYYTGVTYGLFQDLEDAATYYIRITEKFPTSAYADDAMYEYLQTLDNRMVLPRRLLGDEYEKYLDKFPHGNHEQMVRNRISMIRTGP